MQPERGRADPQGFVDVGASVVDLELEVPFQRNAFDTESDVSTDSASQSGVGHHEDSRPVVQGEETIGEVNRDIVKADTDNLGIEVHSSSPRKTIGSKRLHLLESNIGIEDDLVEEIDGDVDRFEAEVGPGR